MIGRFLVFLFCVFLCSCASVSVRKAEVLISKPPSAAPEKILVKPFEFYEPGLRVDRSGEKLDRFKHDLQEKFTRNLVRRLPRYVAPAEAIAANAPLPRGNYWLVTGRFDRVNQGSRIMRSILGYGLGGTKMNVSVLVYDLSGKKPRPLLVIETSGGSNAAPGAIGSVAYFVSGITALGALPNALEGVRSGVTFDTVRTTREVTAVMSEYLQARGTAPADVTLKAKRPGEVTTWPFQNAGSRLRSGSVSVEPAAHQ